VSALHSPGAPRGGNEAPPSSGGEHSAGGTEAILERVWNILEGIPDPEIPVVSIRELGILREINEQGGRPEVVITPTYSGCPAMGQIEQDVREALAAHDLHANVVTRLAPAWTTDWITEGARQKLRDFGIAPPHAVEQDSVVRFAPRSSSRAAAVACPHCGSCNTTETSHFSSTACKALYKCLDCLEPFDYFKPY
jgi:ring-1,2-phenylacetyl-CoA epoxidase subunit PaaD